MEKAVTVIGIEVNEIGAVLSIEGENVVTVHEDADYRDCRIVQTVKDAVRIAHVLDYVPFVLTDEAAALYRLMDDYDMITSYCNGLNGYSNPSVSKRDDDHNKVRVIFPDVSAMREDAAQELEAGNDIFGPSAAIEPREDGTFLLTMWGDGTTVQTVFLGNALTLAGFSSDDSE